MRPEQSLTHAYHHCVCYLAKIALFFLIAVTVITGLPAQTASSLFPRQSAPLTLGAQAFRVPVLVSGPGLGLSSSSVDNATLPELPARADRDGTAVRAGSDFSDPGPAEGRSPSKHIAAKGATQIPYDWQAQPLSARDKVRAATENLYSLDSLAAIVLSAGYSHLLNGQPNFGTDRGAFGQRLGADVIRDSTQAFFTQAIFSPLLHEDTRYYAEGPNETPVHRTLYAITRPLITRKDNGRPTVNMALLLGYAASAALTPAFYPSINRNVHDTAATYGASLGGAAFNFLAHEIVNRSSENPVCTARCSP